jgi:hypothetical protein
MRVRMIRPRRFMDAGLERPLDAGASYDLADVVARSLIATGAAVADADAEAAAVAPPETKPFLPPETKHARGRS